MLSIAFSAYLWGIETSKDGNAMLELDRFQPTYEELKHGERRCQYNGQKSFQPTYEELKRWSEYRYS